MARLYQFKSLKLQLLIALMAFWACPGYGQDCSGPVLACTQEPGSANTSTGLPVPLPSSFCFNSQNTVFYSFNTIDTGVDGQDFDEDSAVQIALTAQNCQGDSTYNNQIGAAVFTATDPCDDSSYEAALGCEVDSVINFSLSNLEPGTTYYIAVSGVEGNAPAVNPSECGVEVSISGSAVDYELGIDPDYQSIDLGEVGDISSNPGFDSYEWTAEGVGTGNDADYSVPTEQLDEPQDIPVDLAVMMDGCEYNGSAIVSVKPAVNPPNSFTPNNDGINDTWVININKQRFPNAQVEVFTRWGQQVYQSVNYNDNWDGDGLPAATYYYVIELNPVDFVSEPYTGSVTILR